MAKEKRAAWFKLFLHQAPMILAAPEKDAGIALKAAMLYFSEGTVPELDSWSQAIFSSMKADIDDAIEEYQRSVENGKKGSMVKKEKRDIKPPSTPLREEEKEEEKDEDKEKEAEAVVRQKPPCSRFVPPNEEELREYCNRMGYRFDPMHFMDYYSSNGWRVGKNPMKDWKAALRTWNRKENEHGKTKLHQEPATPTWTVGTTF